MTVQTTRGETTPAQWSDLGTFFEEYLLIFGSSRPETLPQFLFSVFPATTHVADKKCQRAKGTIKGSDKRKKGMSQQHQEFLPPKKFGEASQRFCLIALFSILIVLLPHQVIADKYACSIWGRRSNDATLDDHEVFSTLSEKGLFKGFNMSYRNICANAFAHAPVTCIILSFNKLSSLPVNLFRGINNLEEVELQGNPLTEVPSVLNSTKTVRYLNLADTKIGGIPKYSINGMSGLMVLDLSRTEITDVPEDIFDMSLRLVHLSQTKLDRLPLPAPTSVAFNVTLVGTQGNELSISYPDSGKRKIGINITGIETLTCKNAKTAVESSYCVLAGEIECDHGAFRKINVLLKGKTGVPPSCTRKENANTHSTISDVTPNTPVPIRGTATTPCSDPCQRAVPLHLVIGGSLVSGLIIGAFFGGKIVSRNLV
ncbi:Leucine-rich repeat-containing G-protein coupled receptor 4 [Holothuria leucospilota]|uniref:Leucine-rich repeat-containing G-protein coupled receptor 4 n=1 Tax=Holothuria leucospilota TaxID=206669 RepID=A0A9Q0YHL7_HOLLE|nr:Leucine-rich repeat-containing G-protein coupled receptor 4 [Holothuria leucospilota]